MKHSRLPCSLFAASLALLAALTPHAAQAQTLSATREINFYRDIPSRSLKGLAARSDGALLSGPHISHLLDTASDTGALDADLLWGTALVGETLFVGTGPDGKILTFHLSKEGQHLTHSGTLSLPDDSHLLALAALPDGHLLVGSSPEGTLTLLSPEGETLARAELPVSSILSIDVAPKAYALVATGSPGHIYEVDLVQFCASGSKHPEEEARVVSLDERGITLWGSVRDDALRSLLRLPDGRVIAGSSPKGNVYEFGPNGGPPRVLSENTNAEVTSLLAWEGGFFAAITTGDTTRRTAQLGRNADIPRRSPSLREGAPPAGGGGGNDGGEGGSGGREGDQDGGSEGDSDAGNRERTRNADTSSLRTPAATASSVPQFSGSSRLLWFPDGGYPETVASRQGVAFYQLARHADLVLITAGDEGELLGYDPIARLSLVFAGAIASQVNAIVPLPTLASAAAPDVPNASSFLLLGNNPASLELMRFDGLAERNATTRRIDLGTPAELGALRFADLAACTAANLKVELRTSESSDPLEGWGDWQAALQTAGDPLRYAAKADTPSARLRGRYMQVRLTAPAPLTTTTTQPPIAFEAHSPTLYLLPKNQRPQLTQFAVLPPGNARSGTDTLRKLAESVRTVGYREDLAAANDTALHRTTRVIVWDLSDANGDALLSTLSLRGPGAESDWQTVLIDSEKRYAVFDTAGLPEGRYRTRLVVSETAPRPADERLTATFYGEDLFIDNTPPDILDARLTRRAEGGLSLAILAEDRHSLLLGAEIRLNNGNHYEFGQTPAGIPDAKRDTFIFELTAAEVGRSTALEVTVIDTHYNSTTQRLPLPALSPP